MITESTEEPLLQIKSDNKHLHKVQWWQKIIK